MMGAKDIARKMLVGCGHTERIIVPHAECVESQLAQWEAAIRLDCQRTFASEHRQSIEDARVATENAKSDVDGMSRKIDRLNSYMTNLVETNTQLKERLRLALIEVDNLRASLHAEKEQHVRYPQEVAE